MERCARTIHGHAATAPPSSMMKPRRLTSLTRAGILSGTLVGLDPCRCYDIDPFLCLGPPEFSKVRRRTDFWLGVKPGKACVQLRRTQDFVDRLIELIHHIRRRARRGNDARPERCPQRRKTAVGGGWHRRKLVTAQIVGYRKRLYFSGLNMRQKECDRV